MDVKRIAKDVHKCLKNISNFTQNQAFVASWDTDFLKYISIQIQPNGGPYCGGKYVFKIFFNEQYPNTPPTVECLTNIFHPNIDVYDRAVCLNTLEEDWKSHFGLDDVIQGLMYLLNYPNLEDPLSCWFEPCMDEETFLEKVKLTLRGETIDDDESIKFTPVTMPDPKDSKSSYDNIDTNETVNPQSEKLFKDDEINICEFQVDKNKTATSASQTKPCDIVQTCDSDTKHVDQMADNCMYKSKCADVHNEIAETIHRKFIDDGFHMLLRIDTEGLLN